MLYQKVSRVSRLFQLSTLDMSEVHTHVTTTIEGLTALIDNLEAGENFHRLTTKLQSTLAPYNIPHPPDVASAFLNNIQKPFLLALIENIKERLPDTNIFSYFEIFNRFKLPATSEEGETGKYGEEVMEELAKHYGVSESPLILLKN